MSSRKKRRKNLKKQMKTRELADALAVVICVGKKCCDRKLSREIVEAAREHAYLQEGPDRGDLSRHRAPQARRCGGRPRARRRCRWQTRGLASHRRLRFADSTVLVSLHDEVLVRQLVVGLL
ncbi:MAG: hypothetical protein ABI867_39995 [Kofleriaceae bacterium]